MKRNIAYRWARALDSGKYKQGIGRLKSGNAYCCLGVLCAISKLSKFNDDLYLGHEIVPPPEVIDWAGLRNANGTPEHKKYHALTTMNDRKRFNFKTIADHIRKHWKEL